MLEMDIFKLLLHCANCGSAGLGCDVIGEPVCSFIQASTRIVKHDPCPSSLVRGDSAAHQSA